MAPTTPAARGIESRPFGETREGVPVDLYALTNARGSVAEIATYGGIVTSLLVPDARGERGDVVLGHDALEPYLADNRPYLGALIGRYGNRIGGGRFTLDGRAHALARNNGENHLHGGLRGFDKVVWTASPVTSPRGVALELEYLSVDGEEGYPGNLSVRVTYTLTDADELAVDYVATTDAPTLCNLTHHGYFNLDGAARGDVLGHRVQLAASRFTPVDSGLIPTGELRPVAGTPMDFGRPIALGERIGARDEQLARAGGYDHNWVLDRSGPGLVLAARVEGPASGRVVEVLTTEPGIQLYSGNFLDGSVRGKGGVVYAKHRGLCLETQHFPDSPNHPEFPSTVLRPGETYRTSTVYRFTTVGR